MRGTRWEYVQGVHLLLQILAKLFNRSSFADAKPNLASNVCGPGKDMGKVGKDKGRYGYGQGKQGYGQGRWEGMGFKIARMGSGLVMVASSGGTLGARMGCTDRNLPAPRPQCLTGSVNF